MTGSRWRWCSRAAGPATLGSGELERCVVQRRLRHGRHAVEIGRHRAHRSMIRVMG